MTACTQMEGRAECHRYPLYAHIHHLFQQKLLAICTCVSGALITVVKSCCSPNAACHGLLM
jgi:hypothetical protein